MTQAIPLYNYNRTTHKIPAAILAAAALVLLVLLSSTFFATTATTAYEAIANTYTSLNQLVHTVANGCTVVNTYNGEGLRVAKSINGVVTKYLYEYDKVVLELDGSGVQVGRNVYGLNLVSRNAMGMTLWYMYNGHGDVTALVDSNGNMLGMYYYDAFGNVLEHMGMNSNVTYAGYQWDAETGMYYCNARMYDPLTARFMQEDTYRGDAGDPLSLNRYVYCANNPVGCKNSIRS